MSAQINLLDEIIVEAKWQSEAVIQTSLFDTDGS